MLLNPQIKDRVIRLGSPNNYTTGRTGIIVEINGDTARVLWTTDKFGRAMNLRTWVAFKFLDLIAKS